LGARALWIRLTPVGVVIYQLGVQSVLAISLLAVFLGFSFGFAGTGVSPLDTNQILRLFILLSSSSVGVLITFLIFLLRAVLPVSLIVHMERRWPGNQLGISRSQLLFGASVAAPVLFLAFQLCGLAALSYASDAWLDFSDLVTVIELVQPSVVFASCFRLAIYSILCLVFVLGRAWPLMALSPDSPRQDEASPDPWLPHYRLSQGRLVWVYSDIFRLLLLVVSCETIVQFYSASLFAFL
jgi:hypothetical protein